MKRPTAHQLPNCMTSIVSKQKQKVHEPVCGSGDLGCFGHSALFARSRNSAADRSWTRSFLQFLTDYPSPPPRTIPATFTSKYRVIQTHRANAFLPKAKIPRVFVEEANENSGTMETQISNQRLPLGSYRNSK
ncbi:hypothetical protein J6590_065813 [Homalodisca vitripennis]|nr:hypothetical protein J6590_065813 [Homalodisca vitripennis]